MIAWPAKRIAAVELSRCPLIAMASAPAPQSPLTMICRSPEVTRPCSNPLARAGACVRLGIDRGGIVDGQRQPGAVEGHGAAPDLELLDLGREVVAARLLQSEFFQVARPAC